MPKQLKVSLDFTANTDQAKRQIQDLSKALQQITLKTPSVIDDQQLKKAASAANELQRYLAAAVNVDTGRINLSEFSRQLDKSGRSLKDIYNDLKQVGPQGVSAFNKLSQSLVQAETHSNKLVKKMKEFGTTLANTTRWQISSSILHGLQGAVQSAFYYAKDLDESLNNIRIVTGQNADQMARFAKEANAAAQSLSTTTTAYTNASLIYYQQGLSDKEVKERTDVTVKMANVTGESAQTISEQMTAVWNNFYDGSQSLESFSDKMVALGAATASSSSEISAGLNQFAATASTVGLSFDYAAAALATVTATTRQSANVVGNAFKTLFARLEGLKLGDTLEDGTTLNKYSAALESVGVSIKDQNGELKAMDTILEEMAAKWQTLSKDQQVALAQTVGGVRQYTQLIALMDQWDFMQENLQTVRGSEGALQEQQEIYSEGWQAAADRAKAALEGIYDTLIDDKKLKKLYDFGATALNSINGLIKGLGGIPGILTQIMSWILQIQAKNMPAYIDRVKDGIAQYIGVGKNLQANTLAQLSEAYSSQSINIGDNPVEAIETTAIQGQLQVKQALLEKNNELSESEKQTYLMQLDQLTALGEQLKVQAQMVSDTKDKNEQMKMIAVRQATLKASKNNEKIDVANVEDAVEQYAALAQSMKESQTAKAMLIKQTEIWKATESSSVEEVTNGMSAYIDMLKDNGVNAFAIPDGSHIGFAQFVTELEKFKEIADPTEEELTELKAKFDDLMQNKNVNDALQKNIQELQNDVSNLEKALEAMGLKPSFIAAIKSGTSLVAEERQTILNGNEALGKSYEELKKKVKKGHEVLKGEEISKSLSAIMAFSTLANSVNSVINLMSDSTANFATKLSQGLTSVTSFAMGLGRIIKMMEGLSTAAKVSTGIIGGIIFALQIAISAWQQYHEAELQRHSEQAEKDQEKLKSLQDELSALEELSDKYDELLEKYNTSREGKDELDSTAKDLIDTYNIEDGYLLLLAQDYDGLAVAIKKARTERAGMITEVTGQAISSAKKVFEDQMLEGKGHKSGDEYKLDINSYDNGRRTEGDNIMAALLDNKAEDYSTLNFKRNAQGVNRLEMTTDLTGEGLIKAYEEAQQFVNDAYALAAEAGEEAVNSLQKHDIYSGLVDWLNKAQESYQAYKDLLDTQKGQNIQQAASAFSVESVEAYQQLKSVLEEQFPEDIEKVNDFLKGAYSEFYTLDQGFQAIAQKTKLSEDTIKQLYEDYGDAIFSIDYDSNKTKEAVMAALDLAQSVADKNKIYLEYDTAVSAEKDWKEGMTGAEIEAYWKQYGESLNISKNDFLMMDKDQREDFLAKNIVDLKDDTIQALQAEQAELQKRAQYLKSDEYTTAFEEAQQKYQNIQQQIKELDAESEFMGLSEYNAERNNLQSQLNGLLQQFPDLAAQEEAELDKINEKIAANQELLETEMILLASNAGSLEELKKLLNDGTIDVKAFNEGFTKLRNQLDEDIDKEAFEDMTKYLSENAEDVEELSEQLLVEKKSAEAVAKAILRYDSAIQKVTKHYDEWVEALDSGNEYEQAKALKEIRNNFNDILDLHFDSLSDDFVRNRDNLNLMQQAAEGSEQAYNDLMLAARNDILTSVRINTEDFDTKYADIISKINAGIKDIEVGAYVDDAQAIQAMNELINQAGLTADQATDLLASMGVDAEIEQVKVPEEQKQTFIDAVPQIDHNEISGPVLVGGQISEGGIDVPTIRYNPEIENSVTESTKTATAFRVKSARKSSGGGIKKSLAPSGGGGGGKSGGGGGGGSKKTGQAEHAKKSPTEKSEDRYHVINNQIEDLAKQYDRLSEAEERAFGKTKLDLMDKQKEKLDQQYKAQRQLREEAEKYWKIDLENLQNAAFDSDGDDIPDTFGLNRYNNDDWYAKTHFDEEGNSLGPLGLDLDENGTILNHDALKEAAYDYYNQIALEYNKWLDDNYIGKEVDDALEEQKKQWDEKLKNEEQYRDNFLGLIKQYEDTQDKVQDELNKEIKAYHDELDQMLERTDYAVQVRLDVDDDSLALLNFLMNTLEDNPYRASEAITNLQKQFDVTQDKYAANKQGLRDLFNNHFSMDHVFDNSNADVGNNSFAAKMRELGYDSADALMEGLASGKTNVQQVLGSMGEEFSEEEIGKFREYSKGMMGSVEDMLAIRQNMYKTLDDYIAQSNDDLDRLRDKIDNLSKVTEHWKNIIDLVGRDVAGLDTDMMIENEEKSLNILQAKVAADKDLMDEADAVLKGLKLQQGQYEEGSNEWNEWKKRVEEAEDRLTEMTENYYSSWEEALEAVKTKFEKTMKWLGEDYSKTLGGKAGNLEGLQNLMDQYQKTHDTYVPEFERVYQLNKLNAAAVKAIDETNNIKAKKQLQEYQQQILEAQESGREMSEYELQNLEKELALRQAALALEESRNVKSQVRMQRDNEGNYSYVYTADEDAVADAENNYRDKLYEMQKANYEYINELQNNIVSLQQDYQQAIANAAETYGYGTEAYYDAVDKINSYYDEALKAQYNELNLAMKNNQDLQEFDKNFHAQMTHDKSVSDEGYITSFDQTLYSQLTGYQTLEDATRAWSQASTEYTSGAEKAVKAYKDALEKTCNYAGTTLAGQAGDTGPYAAFGQKAKQAFTDARNAAVGEDGESGFMGDVEKMAKRAKEALVGEDGTGGLIGDVGAWVKATVGLINGTEEEAGGIVGALNNVIALLTGVKTGIDALPDEKTVDIKVNVPEVKPIDVDINYNYNTNGSPADTGGGSDGNEAGPAGPTGPTERKRVSKTPTGYKDTGDGSNHFTTYKITYDNGDVEITDPIKEPHTHGAAMSNDALWMCPLCYYTKLKVSKAQEKINSEYSSYGAGETWRKIDEYATGGFTGSWGDTGKLALLHEKELVLNKEDTANMLAAVGMIRQISDVIDLNAKSSSGAFSSLFAANVRTGAQELQQDVHITAEFPNATDHNEILEAFDNVINLASQYANRKVQPAYTSF